MFTSTIVLIILRLFSVQWFILGLAMLATAIAGTFQMNGQEDGWAILISFIPSVGMLLSSIVGWLVAPFLGRFIAGKYDTRISVPLPSLQDLYAFAFVFLGLYFVLSSLANFLYWLHFSLIIAASHGNFDPERKKSLYEFVRPLITLVAGLLCMLSGKRWAKRLSDTGPET